ncbi:hypothetical protein ABZ865_27600 [Streptomyces sp. NPDC047085]|uniref:hypothetical protein n=1 Tax=Streptomyces sp. NPDC047085 TaxID=3155140 RepID=UPI0033F63D36
MSLIAPLGRHEATGTSAVTGTHPATRPPTTARAPLSTPEPATLRAEAPAEVAPCR